MKPTPVAPDMWVRVHSTSDHFPSSQGRVLAVLDTVATVLLTDGNTVRRAWVDVAELDVLREVPV